MLLNGDDEWFTELCRFLFMIRAHASASSLTDRRCLAGLGKRRISEEDMLSCSPSNGNYSYNGCDGGSSTMAYNYVRENGITFTDQYPLVSITAMEVPCKTTERLSMDRTYVGNYTLRYGLFDEDWFDELMDHGSFPTRFDVFDSLSDYSGGV